MAKEKSKKKQIANAVGATIGRPHFGEMAKNQKGITLIALIITIIVMLILVGVTINVALNGGLFNTASTATQKTEKEAIYDQIVGAMKLKNNGNVNVKGTYDAVVDIFGEDKVIPTNPTTVEDDTAEVTFTVTGKRGTYTYKITETKIEIDPEGWSIAETKPEGWSANVTAITDGSNTIPLPNGFKVSTKATEDEVTEGLVITEGGNEFVWVPVTDSASYTEDSFGPLTGEDTTRTYVYDSQEELDYYYGTDYYDYDDFTYETDKTNVETSIQTYGGFYVGRYETTIDGSTIGTQAGKTILTAATLLKEETNETSNDEYHYRWWGLYKAQKDMYANNSSVGSLMISSKQWDSIMTFTSYGSAKRATNTYTTKPDLSGSSYSTDSSAYDVSKNIYDLAGNVVEFSLKAVGSVYRTGRGGSYDYSSLSASDSYGDRPASSSTGFRF